MRARGRYVVSKRSRAFPHPQSTVEEDEMPEFIRQFLLQKFGLPSLSDGCVPPPPFDHFSYCCIPAACLRYLYSICKAIRQHKSRSRRLVLFGRMVGVLDPDRYRTPAPVSFCMTSPSCVTCILSLFALSYLEASVVCCASHSSTSRVFVANA